MFWVCILFLGTADANPPIPLNTPRGLDTSREMIVEVPHPLTIRRQSPFPIQTASEAPLPVPLNDTFTLHSNPSASKVIYLDFDGHTIVWDGEPFEYGPWNAEGSEDTFSDLERTIIQRTWQSVSEDFLPFDIDITTEDPGVEALRNTGGSDTHWGIRAVINHSTDDYSWAYEDSFTDSEDTEMYIWTGEEDNAAGTWLWTADSITHEAGHALGLSHDGTTNGVEYYAGHGTGTTSWAPIMGWTHDGLSHWSIGEYTDANNFEDDLAIITGQNGFEFRRDDHGDTADSASVIALDENTPIMGIIETPDDLDAFSFRLEQTSTVRLWMMPNVIAPNLDIEATLLDASGAALQVANPIATLDAAIEITLQNGHYTLLMDGVGYEDPNTDGYTDYGSLGRYTITAEVDADTPEDPNQGGCSCAHSTAHWGFGVYVTGFFVLLRTRRTPIAG